jgi:hypothetical protein
MRNPEVVYSDVSFEKHDKYIVAIFHLPFSKSTVGLRFTSPEQMLELFDRLMQEAVLVWPDDEWIKEYLSE